MSLNFRKHNPKSFVVRGDIIENISSRQQLISKLSGKCVYNTRLKFGNGLLVPINDKNEQVLNEYQNPKENKKIVDSVMVPYDGHNENNKESIKKEELKDLDNLEDLILKLMNETDEEKEDSSVTLEKEKHTFDIINNKLNQKMYLKESNNKNQKKSKNQHKEKQVSIIDNIMTNEDKKGDRKNIVKNDKKEQKESTSRDSRDSRELSSREKRDSRELKKNSEQRDMRKRSRSSRRHDTSEDESSSETDYSSSSDSEYSGDSSEDERIQETIRRKGKRPDRKIIEISDTEVDSDHEDVVTLSRRVRYLMRKVKSIDEYLRRK